jgi:hypothetical protein
MPTAEQKYQQTLEQDRARQRLQDEENAEGSDGQNPEDNRMGWGIFSIAFILSAIADIAEFITVGTIGWFVGLVVDLILLAMLGFSKAGKKQWKKWVWGPIIEKIPVLSTIPFRIAFLIWAFVASRNTKLQKVQKVMEFRGATKNNIEAQARFNKTQEGFEQQSKIIQENQKKYQENRRVRDLRTKEMAENTGQKSPNFQQDIRESPIPVTNRWRDKSVDEAMRLRNERLQVAERLGMSKEEAAKKTLDLEGNKF